MSDRELIAAYLDGVGELTADERRRIDEELRANPELRAEADASKALITELRTLPPEGSEPDWTALEREIRIAVGTTVPSRWRLWRWLVPVGTLAVTAAVMLLVIHHPASEPKVAMPILRHDAGVPAPAAELPGGGALWLDGQIVELDDVDTTDLLDDEDTGGDVATGLLPTGDLRWVDALDDSAIDRAESWLDKTKKKKG